MRRMLIACVMVLVTSSLALAADVTGKWVGSVETPNGPIELTYELKAEGEVVTGTVASPMGSLPIADGKLVGDTFTYTVNLEGSTITHEAKVNATGDEIAIKATGDWGVSEYVVKKAQ